MPPPPRQRNWAKLSPAYRQRLGRAGISQRDYESGKSLAAARGHGKTPERPERAYRQPTKYREYITKHRGPITGDGPRGADIEALLQDIRDASPDRAAGGLRVILEQQHGPTIIELAQRLGVQNSIPDFNRFGYADQLRIAEIWLRAFMTHARAADDPSLAAERFVLTGGRHGGYSGILPEIYKQYGLSQNSKQFWSEFKRSYSAFFTSGIQPGI